MFELCQKNRQQANGYNMMLLTSSKEYATLKFYRLCNSGDKPLLYNG